MNRASLFIAFIIFAGCGGNGTSNTPPPAPWQGTLAVDIRNHVDVTLQPGDAGKLDVTLHFTDGDFQLFDPSTPLKASGRVEPFAEAALDLYTAHFASSAISGGPCANKPISLALSLSRRQNNDRVGGSLTAYCGADTWFGTPARVLRLTGTLPKATAQ